MTYIVPFSKDAASLFNRALGPWEFLKGRRSLGPREPACLAYRLPRAVYSLVVILRAVRDLPLSGARRDDPQELALCERFLDLAREKARGPEYLAALESIYPVVRRIVERVFRKWRDLPDFLEAEDLAHEVFMRLQKSPPTRQQGQNARLTVLKWIGVVARHYLTDLGRKASFREIRLGPEQLQEIMDDRRDRGASDSCGSEDLDRRIDEGRILSEFEDYLRVHYPRGSQCLQAQRSHPGATIGELARILGTTRENVYQIRSRLKDWAVKWRKGITS